MKHFHVSKLAFLIVCIALLAVGCSTPADVNSDYTVRVLLPENDGYTFLGSQILRDGEPVGELSDARALDVLPGQSVRFAVKTAEGMILDCKGDNVSWEDGYITVENIRKPTTIQAEAKKGVLYTFSYNANNKSDDVSATHENGSFILKNTEITLHADIPKGQKFEGFSTGNYLAKGGKLVSTDTEFTFRIKGHTVLFANYSGFSEQTVHYHPNGGVITVIKDAEKLTDTFKDSFYYCPNTRPDKGFFKNDGYVLIGYNTKADGTGDYYGLGWNVVMPAYGAVDLYCQWAKPADASDFEYIAASSGITITGYNGDSEFLVIPEYIENRAVRTIARGAFVNASFKEVYIPKTVTSVISGAFASCAQLEKVNLSDSILTIYDDSFTNCPLFKTLAPQATRYPSAVSPTNFTHHINFERLITRQNNIMLIVSGSTNIYGLSAKKLEKALGNKWDVVTYATVASTPNTYYAEIGLNFLDKDDILIFAPEASPEGHQWGTNTWKDYGWQINEGSYDAVSLVDISNYKLVFSSFATYNKARAKVAEKTYEFYLKDFNEYGEHVTFRTSGGPQGSWIKWNTPLFFSSENVKNLNRVLDEAKAREIPTLIGWLACAGEDTLIPEARVRENQLKYMALAAELYHADFFGDLANHLYPPQYVYDSAMHLTTEGGIVRTLQVIKDVKAALIEHGLYKES